MATEKVYSLDEVAAHKSDGDCWIVIDGTVLDVSKFLNFHPGSKGELLRVGGTDCTEEFYALHREEVLAKYKERFAIGKLAGASESSGPKSLKSKVPFAEWDSPFYTESHKKFRKVVREFVRREIAPAVEMLEKKDELPSDELMQKMGSFGLLACSLGPGKHLSMAPALPGGIKPEEFDYFHEAIAASEIKVGCGSWGVVDGLAGGLVIGLPPVINFGSKELVERIVPPILKGEKRICLAITDPYAGSDVANTTCTAELSADGSHYIVNGVKKWITGGCGAHYFSTLVRTSGKGHGGVSMLLIERGEGVETTKIQTSYTGAGTAYVTFENVKVPVGNLLGKVGQGFAVAMANFNHERWSMAVGGNALNRLIVSDCFLWAYHRKAFGKRLIQQPQIQEKLAEMVAYTDSVQSYIDIVTDKMNKMNYKQQTMFLAGTISLLKNQQVEASRKVCDHAIQIFGGRALTASGLGKNIERFQRSFQFGAVLGGASSVLATQAIRHALKFMPPDARL